MLMSLSITAQDINKFEQLGTLLPTPNETRSASGAPGHAYWQQKADYVMSIHLDDQKQMIRGKETITYHNQSPDALNYLWLQLDQNNIAPDADSYSTRTGKLDEQMLFYMLSRGIDRREAQALLQWAFIEDAVSRVDCGGLREEIERLVAAQLHEVSSLDGLLSRP
jgi:hypothetical protein